MQKTVVMILFGGRSTEHEISIVSARNVLNAIDSQRYSPILVGITKDSGKWHLFSNGHIPEELTTLTDATLFSYDLVNLIQTNEKPKLTNLSATINISIDFALPILHGKYGEDGCLQGLFRMYNLPFSGPSVAASAACMDKDFAKRIWEGSNIPVIPYVTTYKHLPINYATAKKKLGPTLFIKPANTGSSVGVYKSKTESEFNQHLKNAFKYDDKVVIEQAIDGREIECAVLGNKNPTASLLGEIKPRHEFYSYEAKYSDPNGAELCIPADLPDDIAHKIRTYATLAYSVSDCIGFSRVDFFLQRNGEIYLNEINTIPGFTNISMYPQLMETIGISYSDLITRIIELGMDEFQRWNNLSTEHIS